MTDKIEVTQADVARKMRWQQRLLTEGIGESELLDEEFAAHRIAGERAGMERAAGIADKLVCSVHMTEDESDCAYIHAEAIVQTIRAQAGEQMTADHVCNVIQDFLEADSASHYGDFENDLLALLKKHRM